jgi:hypothetical protein
LGIEYFFITQYLHGYNCLLKFSLVLVIKCVGVTSFNIDFAAKKVTVVGDVTPLSVIASISKVKTAQIWPESASPNGSTGAAAESKK